MNFERYDERKHGRVGRNKRASSEWDRLFEALEEGPVVARGVSRNSIYHQAARRKIAVKVEALLDGDGYVVDFRG